MTWLATRDELYEEIMAKAWNVDKHVFGQSYEDSDVLDSAVLIMPLVFFMQPVSPFLRFDATSNWFDNPRSQTLGL